MLVTEFKIYILFENKSAGFSLRPTFIIPCVSSWFPIIYSFLYCASFCLFCYFSALKLEPKYRGGNS